MCTFRRLRMRIITYNHPTLKFIVFIRYDYLNTFFVQNPEIKNSEFYYLLDLGSSSVALR